MVLFKKGHHGDKLKIKKKVRLYFRFSQPEPQLNYVSWFGAETE